MTWWQKLLLTLGAFIVWGAGLLGAGSFGYDREYFWVSACLIAIGGGASPFWRFRGSAWYWCTLVALAVINITLVCLFMRDFTPTKFGKPIVQVLMVGDLITSWIVIISVHRLKFHHFPWDDAA